jgi:type IV secretory pathway VirD2 relaxase
MEQNVSVDESMLLWKGHLGLIRYIPSKRDRWGLKFYGLCESSSGYTARLIVDEGSYTEGVDLADQKRHGRQVARRRLKRWYRKVYIYIM